jgi:hypothetical protein
VPRDDERPPPTRPEGRRPSVTEVAAARERLRQHPGAEPSSLPPAEPVERVEDAPRSMRRWSLIPREIPSWVGKAAAALFAAVVLPNVPAITRRIDAGTAVVVADAELKREQAKTEQAKQLAEKARLEAEQKRVTTSEDLVKRQNEQEAKLKHCELLEQRVGNLEGDNALGIFARKKRR